MTNDNTLLIRFMSDALTNSTLDIILKRVAKKESLATVLDIILSAHISSLFNCFNEVTAHLSEEDKRGINFFLTQLEEFILGNGAKRMDVLQ